MANPLVATTVDTTSPFSGAYLIEDGQALVDAVASGNWIDGGMAAFSAALDTAAMIVDPIGTLIANGLGWVLDHVEPLKGWLNDVTGDAGEVAAFAQTWRNVAGRMHDGADTFARRTHDLDGMSGATVDAYLAFAGDTIAHLRSTGDWANAIAGGLEVASQLVQIVHDLVRDAISQIVGTAISVAAEVALTVGFATPAAIGQITTKVASLATRVGKTVTRLLSSLKKLSELLQALQELFGKGSAVVSKMLRGGHGAPSRTDTTGHRAPSGGPLPRPVAARPPAVDDADLQNRLNQAYIRDGVTDYVGDGSLVDAIRQESRSGELIKGKNHREKGQVVVNSIRNWLRRNPDARASDREAATNVMNEILDALEGER